MTVESITYSEEQLLASKLSAALRVNGKQRDLINRLASALATLDKLADDGNLAINVRYPQGFQRQIDELFIQVQETLS